MRIASFLLLLFVSTPSAWALTYEFIGSKSEPLLRGEVEVSSASSVMELTLKLLEDAQLRKVLEFKATPIGLLAINADSGEGDESLELISDTQMKAYGWCFSLDGIVPKKLANEVFLQAEHRTLRWFYAYAYYDREWKSWCVPYGSPYSSG